MFLVTYVSRLPSQTVIHQAVVEDRAFASTAIAESLEKAGFTADQIRRALNHITILPMVKHSILKGRAMLSTQSLVGVL